MSKFNQSERGTNKTVNKSGNAAYKLDDRTKLVTMVLTSMVGEPKFYGDNTNELAQLAKSVDPAFVAKLAIYAREEFHMRSVSHMLAAIVANQNKEYTKSTVNGVVERVDDITEILACYLGMYGKPIPNALKKALAANMGKFDEYQCAKYNGGSKQIKLRDVLRLTHPVPANDAQAAMFGRILSDTLETPYTWEVELSARGNTKEVWEELIDSGKVGYMALLRNLKNILAARPRNIDTVYERLQDRENVLKSKQLPFRFFSAYKVIKDAYIGTSKVYDALEIALRHSIDNIQMIPGKTLIAIDVSGSMGASISSKSTMKCSDIASLFAAMANRICEEAKIVSFDTRLYNIATSSLDGIIQTAQTIRANGGGTNINLPLKLLCESKESFDRIIMFSDNEINCGYRTAQSYADAYRREVNPNFWVHAVDLQGYGTAQFIGGRTNILAGWSERVLEFIALIEAGTGSLVDKIDSIKV